MNLRRTTSLSCLFATVWFLILVLTFLPVAHCWSFSTSADFQSYYVIGIRVFTSIQEAINEAENGSVVLVPAGVYYEHVIFNKSISLIGENISTTIIDGSNAGTVVAITADNVSISGFTIRNSGYGWTRHAIYVYRAKNCQIESNYIFNTCHNIRLNYSRNCEVLQNVINGTMTSPTMYGIRIENSNDCVVADNGVSDCVGAIHLQNATNCTVSHNRLSKNSQGIRMYSPCTYNKIAANIVYGNTYEGMIEAMPSNNTFLSNVFFHNNFINNTNPFLYKTCGNIWDDGYPSGGNYWSRYNGTDLYSGAFQNETGSDGIGDTPYAVNAYEGDQYPLMRPYGSVCNLNTSIMYPTIQSAIDASETLSGHTLQIGSGIYYENLHIHKSLKLLGEDKAATFVDGRKVGTVIHVDANNVSLSKLTIQNSGSTMPPFGTDYGIFLDHSVGSSITDCVIRDNLIGLYVFFSSFSVIEHNIVLDNLKNGIWIWYSNSTFMADNQISGSEYNFGVFGGAFSHFDNNIDATNTAEGKPILYRVGVEDETFHQTNVSTFYLINCNNVTVQNLNLSGNCHGVFLFNVTSSRVENIRTLDNSYGIYLQASRNNTVRNNHCTSDWVGICLQDSDRNAVFDNVAKECEKGISLYKADNNEIIGNSFLGNIYGMRFFSSSLNVAFHNNLIGNDEQVSLITSYQNVWDNGCEGNFWSDYNGTDLDGDGIGDTFVPWSGSDYYPLVSPYLIGDVNHDGKVTILDLVKVSASYMTTPSDPKWNPHADIAEPFGIIDYLDIERVTKNYGDSWREPCGKISSAESQGHIANVIFPFLLVP